MSVRRKDDTVAAAWYRFALRLIALSTLAGGFLVIFGLMHHNVAIGILGGSYLTSAFWMAAWTWVDR
jgi:hypothetical protein